MQRSGTLACPITSAPASRSRVTTTSSPPAIRSACTGRPSVRRSPRTAKLSLIDIGTPSSGPASARPCWASALAASDTTSSARTSANELVSGLSRSMRSRCAATISARLAAPLVTAACSSAMVAVQGSPTVGQCATARSGEAPNRGRRRAIVPASASDEGAAVVRSDAEENVQRLLRAARDAVGEEGAGVGVRAIAERAEVGVTTLYRHFRDKWALIDGVAVHRWSTLRALAEGPVSAGGELARIVLLLDTFTRMVSADDRLITGAG